MWNKERVDGWLEFFANIEKSSTLWTAEPLVSVGNIKVGTQVTEAQGQCTQRVGSIHKDLDTAARVSQMSDNIQVLHLSKSERKSMRHDERNKDAAYSQKKQGKDTNMVKSFNFFHSVFIFALTWERISIKMHSIKRRLVIGLENVLFAKACVCVHFSWKFSRLGQWRG